MHRSEGFFVQKLVKWVCFFTSGCVAAVFCLMVYLSTLLPDNFLVTEGSELSFAALPFLDTKNSAEVSAVASVQKGNSYNTTLTLGGIMPIKSVHAKVVSRRVVQVCGTPFGIKMFANGAMVVSYSDIYMGTGYRNPAKAAGLKLGDVISSIGGISTKTNEDVMAALQKIGGSPAEVEFTRGDESKTTRITAVLDSATNTWRTGMWVRDSSAGIGTLTFVDNAIGVFAGLGHSIHDIDTGTTISLLKGEIVPVEITGSVAGNQGVPGELKGKFLSNIPMGNISLNGETGVYGTVTSYLAGNDVEVSLAQEVEVGKAEILTTIAGGTPRRYQVEIEKIALSTDNPNRNMVVHITDPTLLAATGGIVQGMSGTPILQNGRLVGAVTHVLVNDPTRGYAIFAENMVETSDIAASKKAAA